jgi:hypothetical protein
VIEAGLAIVCLIVGLGEFYLWHSCLLWHEPKRDTQLSPASVKQLHKLCAASHSIILLPTVIASAVVALA